MTGRWTRLLDPQGWRLWHSYAADGSPRENLTLPSALGVMEIGNDHVLGVLREESGDARVVRYWFACDRRETTLHRMTPSMPNAAPIA